MAGALAKRTTGPPGRARDPSAAGPRGCQATLLTRVSLRRWSARPRVPRAAGDDLAVPRYRPVLAKWAFLFTIRGQGAVQLDYKLTDHISVEAESGTRQGADVIYRLER